MAEKKKTVKKPGAKSGARANSAKNTTKKKNTDTRVKAQQEQEKGLSYQTKAILMFGIAAVLFFVIIIESGGVWLWAHNFLAGLFGFCAILLPLFLAYIAVITALERKIKGKSAGKLLLAVGVIICIATTVYVFNGSTDLGSASYFSELGRLYNEGVNNSGAGLLSGLLGFPLMLLCGEIGAQIFSVIALIVLLMLLFGVSLKNIILAAKKPADKFKDAAAEARENRRKTAKRRKIGRAAEQPAQKTDRRSSFNVDVPIDGMDNELRSDSASISSYEKLKAAWDSNNQNEGQNSQSTLPAATTAAAEVMEKKKRPRKSSPDQLQPDPQTVPVELSGEEERGQSAESGYRYPPLELLTPSPDEYADSDAFVRELKERGDKLISTLESFGVRAKITDIARGPSVTRFELQPAAGIKISKITNLSDDIAMNLAAERVRIEAPIPGKAAVGIEIPNKTVTMVSMRELIGSQQFKNAKSKLTVVLGKDISGNIVITDLAKMPHLLIAGTTGSGKSVCVNSLLLSILYKATPDEVKIVLIDPKMVEFSKYKGVPHLLVPVVSDVKKAAGALNWAVSEMLERYKIFAAYSVRDIESYNKMVDSYKERYKDLSPDTPEEDLPLTEEGLPIPKERLPKIVIAIDELADLMMVAPNEVEESICRLAQMARAAGMHLVIATQRPSVNVITGVIKANIPSRIALKTSSQIDSRTILDLSGAEKLLGRGDMLFAPIGCSKPLRVQGGYSSDDEIENVTAFTKKSAKLDYNEEIVEQIEKIASTEITGGKKDDPAVAGGDSDADPMLNDAIKLVVEAGQASTSLLQRRLRLGYARAGRLIDEMEQMGVVGPHEGSKSRKVLMSYQEWLERNNMMSG